MLESVLNTPYGIDLLQTGIDPEHAAFLDLQIHTCLKTFSSWGSRLNTTLKIQGVGLGMYPSCLNPRKEIVPFIPCRAPIFSLC